MSEHAIIPIPSDPTETPPATTVEEQTPELIEPESHVLDLTVPILEVLTDPSL
jgi:hypothetical protein